MQTTDYAKHIRGLMLHAFMDHISQTPDEEIINQDFDSITQQHPEISRTDFNRAIIEGTSSSDVLKLLNLPTTVKCPHCDHEQEIDSEADDETDDDDDEMDSEAHEEVDNEIAEMFDELISEVASRPGGAVVLTYSYCDDESFDADKIRGRTMIFGDREIVDIVLDEVDNIIEECTDEDGFVNTSCDD